MTIIAVANQKGGVGKTTIAFNLSKFLAKEGKKVLVIDNDPQGNLTASFLENPLSLSANVLEIYNKKSTKIEPQLVDSNISLLGSNIHLAKVAENNFDTVFELKEWLNNRKQDYDFTIIDSLPSFGYLNMASLNAADHVLIPTQPSPYAYQGINDLMDVIDKMKGRTNPNLNILGFLFNKVEGTQIAMEHEKSLRKRFSELVFKTVINKGVRAEESPSFQKSIAEYDPKSKVAGQFADFFKEFKEKLAV
jgi:chromosome partitioning protein